MPAATVDDILTLPRLADPDRAAGTDRAVQTITTAPSGFEGEGFPVHRAFAGVPLSALDPFIHMDQMGEVEYAPGEPEGMPWHPHRGFETVTYIIDGVFEHEDSTGGGGVITNGDTQWMTAGKGILHIEKPPEPLVASGGLFHGIQLWVNLPSADKIIDPRYQDLRADEVLLLASSDGGALVRAIAGDLGGHTGPGSTHTPIAMLHVTASPGSQVRLPWNPAWNGLVYGLSPATAPSAPTVSRSPPGAARRDRPRRRPHARRRRVAGLPHPGVRRAVLGGRPIGEPVAAYGPFVMNTRAEIQQAFEDFQAGRLGEVPAGKG